MATTTKKPVDRQATFDTDPNRAPLTQGNLKLPVIEAQAKEKKKSVTTKEENRDKSNRNEKQDKHPAENENQSSGGKTKDSEKLTRDNDLTRKANALSSLNKRVNKNDTSLGVSRESDVLTNPLKPSNQTGADKKNTQDINTKRVKDQSSKTGKAVVTDKSDKEKKESNSPNTSQNKGNTTKIPDTRKNTESKTDSNKQTAGNFSNATLQGNDVDKQPLENRSRNPDKKAKASVLKDLNRKRSVSPVKRTSLSPTKETKSSDSNENLASNAEEVKSSVDKNSVNRKSTTKGKQDEGIAHAKPSPRVNKLEQEIKSHTKQSPRPIKDEDKKKNESTTLKTNVQAKEQKVIKVTPLPKNKPPAETHLKTSGQKEANDSKSNVDDRTVVNKDDKPLVNSKPVDKISQDESQHLETITEVNAVKQESKVSTIKQDNKVNDESREKQVSGAQQRLDSIRENQVSVTDTKASVSNSNKLLTASVQSKHETYVLSPSPTKVDSKSPKGFKVSQPGRLSPSNESVEPIKLEPKPHIDKTNMDGERRESYAQVFAERNTLLKAEQTYRKRIKQLEDEANGFLKAIEELTNENKYLRGRVDTLEGELRGQGDFSAIDKISFLEKDKIELENRIKQMEKEAKNKDSSEELRELKDLVVRLQTDNLMANEQNSKLRSENEENLRKIHSLETEKTSLATSVTDVESEKLGKIQELNNEQKLMSKEMKELKSKNEALFKKVDALEYENKALSETLAQKKTELNEILGVMKDENKFDNEIKELKSQVLKLSKENKEMELAHNKEKRILNEKLKGTEEALETKSKDLDELKIKLDESETENKKIKTELDPMKRLIDNQKKEISKLKDENERLKQELKTSKEKYTKLEHESENATKELKEAKVKLELFNKDLQKIVSEKESQISKLINQLDTMREERERERKLALEDKEKMAAEVEKSESYQANVRRLEADVKHFVEKLDESRLKEKQLNLQLEDKTFQISNLEQQVFEINMKMENYSKRMNELDREKREMEQEKREWDVKKDKMDDIEASNKRLLEENKRLRNQLEMTSYLNTYRPPPSLDRPSTEKPVLEAWISDSAPHSQPVSHALYVQKEKEKDHRKRRVHLVQPQPSIQKKRMPFSKSSPVRDSRQHRKEESKSSNPSTHRSLEDLRKLEDNKTPESDHSLPVLKPDAKLAVGYGGFGGYREIHKNRIRAAAYKKVF